MVNDGSRLVARDQRGDSRHSIFAAGAGVWFKRFPGIEAQDSFVNSWLGVR